MSKMRELSMTYASEDKCIPVEYATPSGELVRGVVSRVGDDGVCYIAAQHVDSLIRAKVVVNGFAGPANPQQWCLTRSAQAVYSSLSDPKFSQFTEKNMQILPLMWQTFGHFFTPRFTIVEDWPGRDILNIAGFILVSQPGEKRMGFLVYNTMDTKPVFMAEIPKTVILKEFTPA